MLRLLLLVSMIVIGCIPALEAAPEPKADISIKDIPPWGHDNYKADAFLTAAMK